MSTIYRSITAAGATQGTATDLTVGGTYFEISTCETSADGVQLPTASAGDVIQVNNLGDETLKIYPQSGGTMAGGATDAADSLTSGSLRTFTTANGLDWIYLLTGIGAGLQRQVNVSADATLTEAQSGSLVSVTGGGSVVTITLPTAKAGIKYKIAQKGAAGAAAITVKSPGVETLLSGFVYGDVTKVALAGRNNVSFAVAAAISSDWITVECDGTNWLTYGHGSATGAFTTAS